MTSSFAEIDTFKLQEIPGDAPTSHVVFEQRVTDKIIDGCVLEAQYLCSSGFLLFTSDDTPFEEVLHIRLLNRRLDTIDAVELKQIYHPGLLSHLRVLDDFNLTFSFFGNDCWCLRVDPQASVRWNFKPFASVHYPGWPLGSHHLKLVKCRAPLAS